MDLATLLFWIIAIILVGSSLLVVGLRNIVHSALALVVVFAMAAGIYLLLNAEFIAIVQILIYAGAVTILILFALMLSQYSTAHAGGATGYGPQNAACPLPPNNVAYIGELLYSPTCYSYVLPFEIASLVLLVAIIGAIVIGRED